MSATVVKARGLTKRYGELTAVKGLDLDVHAGEVFGLLGPNGAGKSTAMRMIHRVTSLTEGQLEVFGLRAGEQDRAIKARLGVVPQMDNLDEELSVLDNLLIYARYYGIDRATARKRAGELLEFLELTAKAGGKISHLSGGMKRRLTLARGLMNEPELLILDEPTTGLDPQVRLHLWDKLAELRARGVTLLLSTHYMEEAERLCDRLCILDHGAIIAQGPPRELVEEHVSAQVVEARLEEGGLEPLQSACRELGIELLPAVKRVSLFVEDGRQALSQLEGKGLFLNGAYVRPGNLEDVFLKLAGRSMRE